MSLGDSWASGSRIPLVDGTIFCKAVTAQFKKKSKCIYNWKEINLYIADKNVLVSGCVQSSSTVTSSSKCFFPYCQFPAGVPAKIYLSKPLGWYIVKPSLLYQECQILLETREISLQLVLSYQTNCYLQEVHWLYDNVVHGFPNSRTLFGSFEYASLTDTASHRQSWGLRDTDSLSLSIILSLLIGLLIWTGIEENIENEWKLYALQSLMDI